MTVGGASADQAEAFGGLGLALLAAVALVFIVMVAAFRSLAQPFILLVSVPFAAVGALIALVGTNTPLGVPALIGALLLVGIVVSNAIVLIDLINQYRQDSMGLDEAVREGARKRLRPIVRTALATVFALAPMGVGLTGGGAFISQPLALVVIGGLVSSTLLTLYVVPVTYTVLERRAERRRAAGDEAGRTVRRPLTGAFPAFQTVGRQAAAQRHARPARHSRPTPAQTSQHTPPQHAAPPQAVHQQPAPPQYAVPPQRVPQQVPQRQWRPEPRPEPAPVPQRQYQRPPPPVWPHPLDPPD